nr:5-hydroxyisourate hydrolase-like [Pan troglodytes]
MDTRRHTQFYGFSHFLQGTGLHPALIHRALRGGRAGGSPHHPPAGPRDSASGPQGSSAEPPDNLLTTHVLDTASGLPARGLCLRLYWLEDHSQQWAELRTSYTDPDGRCPGLLTPDQMKAGTYKLTFDTEGYWRKRGQESFYPHVEVVLTITSKAQKFHVPLVLHHLPRELE